MNIKDKCLICKKNTLGIISKIPFAFDLPMKCNNCNARYRTQKINIDEPWYFVIKYLVRFVNFLISLIWLYLFTAFVFILMTKLNVALMLSLGLIIVMIFIIQFRPYRLDELDSMKDRIKRIENKKQKKT